MTTSGLRVPAAMALAALIAAWSSSIACAQTSLAMKCHAVGNFSVDERIAGCTALIDDPNTGRSMATGSRLRRAMFYVQKGELDLAIRDYDQIIEREPNNFPARLSRASILLRKHDAEAALTDYDTVIEADRKNVYAYQGRAFVHLAKGDPDSAIADYGQILQIHPENVKAYVCRSAAYRRKHDPDRALADCNRAIEISPEREYGYLCRSEAYWDKDDIDHVMADVERAVQLNPRNPSAYLARARAQQRSGNSEAASASLDQAIQIVPNNARLYLNRGILQFEAGRARDAVADFNRSSELDPKDTYGQLWIEIARRRSAQPSMLAGGTKLLDMSKWPAPIIRFFLGEVSFEALIAAADDSSVTKREDHICEVNFYAGELALANGAKGDAMRLLHHAADDCPKNFTEWTTAVAELRSLAAEH